MKVFTSILVVLIVASVGNASVSKVVKPVLKSLTPVTKGLDAGLVQSAGQLNTGLDKTGAALNSITSGVGSIAQGTVSGLGNTLVDLPKALYMAVHNLVNSHCLVANILNTLL